MGKIYTSADQLIGNTPLLELTHIEKSEHLEARILAKLEYFNPAGSVKVWNIRHSAALPPISACRYLFSPASAERSEPAVTRWLLPNMLS